MSKEAQEIKALVESAQRIVVTSHRSPDGDSMGSSAAWYRLMKNLGKNVVVCHPDACPSYLDWVKEGCDWFEFDTDKEKVAQLLNEADLIFSLDYNVPVRLGDEMGQLLEQASAKKVMIDHHLNPADFASVLVSRTSVSSTCQIVYDLIVEADWKPHLDIRIGEAIYLGMLTDTGSFRFASVTSATHRVLADLLDLGVDHSSIHERTFDNVRLERLQLNGYAISNKLNFIQGYPIAYLPLTAEELERYHYQKGDTDGLVNSVLAIEGVKVSIFLTERDGKIKMSFRSKGDIAVNIFAGEFDGGGHMNASGGISHTTMEETIQRMIQLVPNYFNSLHEA